LSLLEFAKLRRVMLLVFVIFHDSAVRNVTENRNRDIFMLDMRRYAGGNFEMPSVGRNTEQFL